MLPEDDNTGAARPCEGGVSPSANRYHLGVESKDVDAGISHPLGPQPSGLLNPKISGILAFELHHQLFGFLPCS